MISQNVQNVLVSQKNDSMSQVAVTGE